MNKSLLAGLIVAAATGAAQSAHACSSIWLTNSSGSPPVIQGSTVQLVLSGISPEIDAYLDSTWAASLVDLNDPPGTALAGPVQITGVATGQHTLYSSQESCVINFSVVPVGAPGTPVLSTNLTHTLKGHPFILSWTVPSGTINHYTLARTVNGVPQSNFVTPASPTSLSMQPFVPPDSIYYFDYAIRACASSDESVCGAWSNTVDVEVDNP